MRVCDDREGFPCDKRGRKYVGNSEELGQLLAEIHGVVDEEWRAGKSEVVGKRMGIDKMMG